MKQLVPCGRREGSPLLQQFMSSMNLQVLLEHLVICAFREKKLQGLTDFSAAYGTTGRYT